MHGQHLPFGDVQRSLRPPMVTAAATTSALGTLPARRGPGGSVHHVAFVACARLSTVRPAQHRLWERAAERLALLEPALTVHLGNLTADGSHAPQSLQFAAECLQDWPTAVRCLPGVSDVCVDASARRVAPGALLRFRRLIGADRWCQPVGRWWLLGVNTTLLGSGSEAEQEQWDWLDTLAASDDRRNLVLCLDRSLPRTPIEGQIATAGQLGNHAAERLLGGRLGARLAAIVAGGTPNADNAGGWRRDLLATSGGWPTVEQLVLGAPDSGMGWLALGDEAIELGIALLDRQPNGAALEAAALVHPE